MVNQSQMRGFLATRRAKITRDRRVWPSTAAYRRAPGLRRGEVALLAGFSVEYYTRLERGNLSGVSEGVLEALSRALQLDEAKQAYPVFGPLLARTTSRAG